MTPIVFVPGMMCDARLFVPQIEAFSASRDICLAGIAQHETMGDLARAVLQNAPPRFAICGLSMGGIVAMEILRQAPERVAKIALLDTNPLAEEDAVKARRFPQMDAVRAGGLAEIMRDEMKPNYLSDGPNRDKILDLCMDMALKLGPDAFIRQSQALMNRPDQTETLRNARIPALVLCGRDDALCPPSRHEFMTSLIPGAELKVIDNAGHLPTLEQPAQTNQALSRWLEA